MVSINVKTNDEKYFVIEVSLDESLKAFQDKVENKTSISSAQQRLLSSGKFVATDDDFNKVKNQEVPNVQVNNRKVPVEKMEIETAPIEKSEIMVKFELMWTIILNI